jgi:hypothetical protein
MVSISSLSVKADLNFPPFEISCLGPLSQHTSGQIFKDDVNGFSSTSDIHQEQLTATHDNLYGQNSITDTRQPTTDNYQPPLTETYTTDDQNQHQTTDSQ